MSGNNNRVLVTGGAGFLGSHLCEKLVASGHDVLCVDNFYTGSKDSVINLIGHPKFELIRHDVTFPLYVEVDRIYTILLVRHRQCITSMIQCRRQKPVCMVQSTC